MAAWAVAGTCVVDHGALIAREIDADDVLAGLSVPVLVIHGTEDSIVLPSMARHVVERCPTADVSWYEGVGHTPFVEAQERFDQELATFVRATHSSTAMTGAARAVRRAPRAPR